MRVLVTGDRGYIGSVLVPMLQRDGFSVVGFDAGWFDGCDFAAPWTRYERRTGDARDLLAQDLVGFDAVVHLAGLPVVGSTTDQHDDDVVSAGAFNLARSAREAGLTRFVQVHVTDLPLLTVVPPMGVVPPVDPEPALAPVAHAAGTGDLLGLATAGFAPVILGHGAPYGSSPQLRLDTALNNLIAAAVLAGGARIHTHPQDRRPFLHVRDLARAIVAALRLPEHLAGTGRFDVVRRRDLVPMSTVVSHVAAIAGPGVRMSGGAEPAPAPAAQLAPALPGFRLRHRLSDGIRELCRALARSGLDETALTSTRFNRAAFLAQFGTNPRGRHRDPGERESV